MAIIYSYPKTTPVASDLLIISRLPSDPNETATYSVSIDDLAGLISGTGTVTTFSATSSIPGITTTVTNSTTTPNLALSITGTPASGTYLDHAGNFTTPPGSGSVGTLSQVLTQGNTTGGSNIVVSSTDNIQASGTNANLKVQGNGTGKLEVRSADTVTPGAIQLNCEQNSHGVSLQSPAHSAGATYTLKLPTTVGTNTQVLQTDGNDPAQLSWAANSGSTNLSNTAYSTNVFLASSTGTDTTIAAATTSLAGVLTAADKTKLDGIQTAADTYDLNAGTKVGINVPLNLTSGSGSDNSLVTLTEGSGVTLTRNSATQITIASSGGGGGISGSGTANRLAVWDSSSSINNYGSIYSTNGFFTSNRSSLGLGTSLTSSTLTTLSIGDQFDSSCDGSAILLTQGYGNTGELFSFIVRTPDLPSTTGDRLKIISSGSTLGNRTHIEILPEAGSSQSTTTCLVDIQSGLRINNNVTAPTSNTPGYGNKGDITYDTGYLYICVANNSWKKIALSSIV